MTKSRLEAFSDAVIAILITIMVLEFKAPHEATWEALRPLVPTFLSYAISFFFLAIYWNNHHHLMQVVHHVDGAVLWANMLLMFSLSFTPFVTAWMGDSHFAPVPVALYGVVMLASALSYSLLVQKLLPLHDADSPLARAIGSDSKGRISILLYAIGLAVSFWQPIVGALFYFAVSVIWFFPDRRVERVLGGTRSS